MTILVETGIAIPPRRHKSKYPFAQMKVGDSFAVPDGNHSKVRAAIGDFTKGGTQAWKFTLQKFGDGYRCWRTA